MQQFMQFSSIYASHSHTSSFAKHAARNTGTAGYLLFLVWKQQARHPHLGCCTVPMNGSFACGSQSGNCAANCPHPRYGIGTMIVSGCLQLLPLAWMMQSGHPPHPQSWRAAKGYLRAAWTPGHREQTLSHAMQQRLSLLVCLGMPVKPLTPLSNRLPS